MLRLFFIESIDSKGRPPGGALLEKRRHAGALNEKAGLGWRNISLCREAQR